MRLRKLLLVCVVALALVPGLAAAQDNNENEDDFTLRVNGPVTIGPDESISSVVVISGDATVAGVVRDSLVVIDGKATVSGRVDGDLTVIGGDLELLQGATVENVSLFDSDMVRADGVTVTGDLNDESWSSLGAIGTVFSIIFWIGSTLVVMLAAGLFARFGRRQLTEAVGLIGERTGGTFLSAISLVIGLPLVAVLAFVTVVGIPISLAIVIFLIPALAFFGYLIAGTWVGMGVIKVAGRTSAGERPYLAAIGGVFLLQLISLIPVIGALFVFLGGVIGAGALVYRLLLQTTQKDLTGKELMPIATPAGA
jgi:hypothetical protein